MAGLLDKVRNLLLAVVVNKILGKLPEATVFKVVNTRSNEWVTYNAMVSVTNPYFTPIVISGVSYTLTLKTSGSLIVSGNMEKGPELPGNDQQTVLEVPMNVAHSQTVLEVPMEVAHSQTVLEVPMKVGHSQMMRLLGDIGAASDSKYQLDLTLTVDLPFSLSAAHSIPLSWEGKIEGLLDGFTLL